MRTFDHPTILAQTTAMLGPALGDHRLDTAFAQRATMSGAIVAAIGVDDAGLLKRSATNAADGWDRINERQQLRDVVGVRASQDRNERNAVGVYEDVVLGTGSRAIRGCQDFRVQGGLRFTRMVERIDPRKGWRTGS